MSKNSKTAKNMQENENELVKNLKNDTKLKETPDFRMQLIAQASMFVEDLANNMYRTSIELNSLPGPYSFYSIDAWKEFLNHPVVRKYIKSFRDEKINMMADTALAEGDKGAISIKKAMQEGGPAVNNSNIVLIRLPEKKDWDD
jgi:hypothetical protein